MTSLLLFSHKISKKKKKAPERTCLCYVTNFSLYSNNMVQIILQHQIIYLKISMTSIDNSKHGCRCEECALFGQTSGSLCPLYEQLAFVFAHVCHIWLISLQDNNAVFILQNDNNGPERKA